MDSRHCIIRSGIPLVVVAALTCSCYCPTKPGGDPVAVEVANVERAMQVHHTIDYIEFGVTDMAEAQRFYGAAFDWKFTDYGPEYAGIQRGSGEDGGFRLEAEVSSGGPLVILYSSDLEASVAAVRAAGGQIVTEPFGFPGGRRFHFKDPSGNELAVWSEK